MSEPQNPYEAPESVLADPEDVVGGSIESALAGEYKFDIGDLLNEAWLLISGFKASFWGAVIGIMFIQLAINGIAAATISDMVILVIVQYVVVFATLPLNAGIFMLAIRRSAGLDVKAVEVTGYYAYIGRLVLLYVLSMVLIMLGYLLFVLPGIYLTVGYIFAIPLLLDKNLSPWRALETSRKAVQHCWFKIAGLLLVIGLILMLSTLALLIGLIWAAPLCTVVLGLLYVKMFGYGREQ